MGMVSKAPQVMLASRGRSDYDKETEAEWNNTYQRFLCMASRLST